jgi:hypothetical protein
MDENMTKMELKRAILGSTGMLVENESIDREFDEMPMDIFISYMLGISEGNLVKMTIITMLLARHIEGIQ